MAVKNPILCKKVTQSSYSINIEATEKEVLPQLHLVSQLLPFLFPLLSLRLSLSGSLLSLSLVERLSTKLVSYCRRDEYPLRRGLCGGARSG